MVFRKEEQIETVYKGYKKLQKLNLNLEKYVIVKISSFITMVLAVAPLISYYNFYVLDLSAKPVYF